MDYIETTSPAVASRLQRLARRKGYVLRRSRRALGIDNLGGFMIVEPSANLCMAGSRFECGPDQVEDWLGAR